MQRAARCLSQSPLLFPFPICRPFLDGGLCKSKFGTRECGWRDQDVRAYKRFESRALLAAALQHRRNANRGDRATLLRFPRFLTATNGGLTFRSSPCCRLKSKKEIPEDTND